MRNGIGIVILTLLTFVAPAAAQQSAQQSEGDPFTRGNRAFQLGQYELAIFEYRQALSPADKRYAETSYNLGACYYALGRKHEAADWFRAALKAQGGRYANAAYALGI